MTNTANLSTGNDMAHDQLALLTEEVERNTRILRRTQQRELRLLQAGDLAALFDELTSGLRRSYQLARVGVVIADPEHVIRHLLVEGGSDPESFPALHLVDSLTGMTPQYVALRTPWLGSYKASDHQLLFDNADDVRSIAIIPIIHNNRLMGSINFGSDDVTRFTDEHAADFLAHLGAIATFSLENVVNRARLLRSGFTDVLTGWHNRRYLQVRLNEELARARRESSNLVCLMIDIDYFKNINDSFGHAAGDIALRELAQRIEAQVRASDVAARYGGEEFVVLMPKTDVQSGVLLAERIRGAVSELPIDLGNGREVTATVSIGISTVSPERSDNDLKTTGESLLARADVALYKAKAAGRNRVARD
jgi:diguanylate cyclase (GGDEF)-like protein